MESLHHCICRMTAAHIAAATGDLLTLQSLLEAAARIADSAAHSTSLFWFVTNGDGASRPQEDRALHELLGSVVAEELNLWNQSALDLLRLKHPATAGLRGVLSILDANRNTNSTGSAGPPEASAPAVVDVTRDATGPDRDHTSDSVHGSVAEGYPLKSSMCQEKAEVLSQAQAGWDVRESTFDWGPLNEWNPDAGIIFFAIDSMNAQTVCNFDAWLCSELLIFCFARLLVDDRERY